MSNLDLMPWVDVETFGLNQATDLIIEVGIKVTDLALNTVAENAWLCWGPYHKQRHSRLKIDAENGNDDAKYVWDMHNKSGLFAEAPEEGSELFKVEDAIVDWLEDNGFRGLPMCGSSVGFDQRFLRSYMPAVVDTFHYRVIDNSSIKELCRRYNPEVYKKLPAKTEQHRVTPDLAETVEEFRFYRDEFLIWE